MSEGYRPLRVLIVGDPGGGKTAAIGSLLEHGQRLYVADFDKNIDPVLQFSSAKALENLQHEPLTDPLAFDQNLSLIPAGRPRAYARFVALLQEWGVQDFGPNDWLVIDTLTNMGGAVMRQILKDHKRFAIEPRRRTRQKEWAVAIERMETLLDFLRQLDCNVIATTHLMRLSAASADDEEEEEGKDGRKKSPAKKVRMTAAMAEALSKRYPATLGQKLPPRLAGQFNVVLQAKRQGHGAATRYVLRTQPDDDVDLKFPAVTAPAEVPGSGLFGLLKILRPQIAAGETSEKEESK